MGYLAFLFSLICVSFTSLSGSKNDTLSVAGVLCFTYKVPGIPTQRSSGDQQNTSFASSWGHVAWPATQSPASVCFSSALTLQVVLGSFVMLPSCLIFLLGDIQGMLLSDASEKLKYTIFPHACCNGKILKNFPQVTYDIYLLNSRLVSVRTCFSWPLLTVEYILYMKADTKLTCP